MDFKGLLKNSCNAKEFCPSCNSHFMNLRPRITDIAVSNHFLRDMKDENKANSIIEDVLDCSHSEFSELHKFEENIEGNMIFRAKKDKLHIVYCIDKKMRIVFLRAIKNFDEYKKFIDEKREIKSMIDRS